MKIAIVVQRYGADINGGAELHARYVAEHLSRHLQVEVLTTCATDYITWRNSLPAGPESVHGITVRRFPVTREREPGDFGRWSERVFTQRHSLRDELAWLEAEGPTSPELIAYIQRHEATFDFFVFFSVRYYHAYHGVRAVSGKALLVPTAERDGALGLAMFRPIFNGVRALMYNSFEERALIHAAAGNVDMPGVVVGIGSEIPEQTTPARFRQKFDFRDRFAIYVGRIDENKGCAELFNFYERYSRMVADGMHLVLIGTPVIPIPDHPRIHHLGFVSDQDKFDALAAAELLIMPSYLESLSMVALEAWALGKPVLANGRCDVLKGQCIRSNGGLYYESFEEFIETLRAIDLTPALAASLGRNGRDYFLRHYAWPVIEQKYVDMLQRLSREPAAGTIAPLPGWFARRRRELPPANDIVAQLPSGPASKSLESQAASPTAAPAEAVRSPRLEQREPRREEHRAPTITMPAATAPAQKPAAGRRRPASHVAYSRRPKPRNARGEDSQARSPRQERPSSNANPNTNRDARPPDRRPRRSRRRGPGRPAGGSGER